MSSEPNSVSTCLNIRLTSSGRQTSACTRNPSDPHSRIFARVFGGIFVLVMVDGYVCSPFCQLQGDAPTDSPRATCDQRMLPLQRHKHLQLSANFSSDLTFSPSAPNTSAKCGCKPSRFL